MLSGTGLESLCHIAESAADIRKKLNELQDIPFKEDEMEKRRKVLNRTYSNSGNADRLIEAVFGK